MRKILTFIEEYWPILLFLLGFALFFWAFASLTNKTKHYTKACNEKGGVALHADNPSRRQCLLNIANPLIINQP